MSERAVSPDTLLRGCWFALEQAGLLLKDAVLLQDAGAHATAAGLALLAREELGRHAILRDLWATAAAGKGTPSPAQVRAFCERHVEKQRRGSLSSTLRVIGGSSVATLLQSVFRVPFDSAQSKAVRQKLDAVRRTKDRRTADDRHTNRMRALYVDLHENGTDWHRPASLDPAETSDWLTDAVADYAIQCDRLTTPEVREIAEPELAKAFDAWAAKPPLPPPVWPQLPEERAARV